MFNALKRLRASELIANEVRQRILGGALRPGEKLPGERDLAGQFKVNRSTVREALKSLADLGLVVIRHGGGAVVQDYMTRAGLQLLPHLFVRDAGGDPIMLRSLLEARRLFAVGITRLAVERATPEEQATLAELVEEMGRAQDDLARLQDLDFDFVQALGRVSRNWVFVLILNSVRPVYAEQRDLFAPLYAEPGRILAAYRKVVASLPERRVERAARAMDAVMGDALRRLAELVEPTLSPAAPGSAPGRRGGKHG
jgi:GntR family transcriptional repressor for pyruvate dehydrogenase complex